MLAYLMQIDIEWRNKEANFRKVRQMAQAAGVRPGGWLLLPEMFATGFDVEHGDLSEGEGFELRTTAAFLADLAQETGCIVQGSGITAEPLGKKLNIAVAYASNGERLMGYAKLHPFTAGGEHKRFQSGSELCAYSLEEGLRVCPFICYDLRFPEVFRHGVRRGAEVFSVQANWPRVRHAQWPVLLQARAIENQAYVLGVNRCGRDRFLEYAGGSVAYDPYGRELARAGEEECVLTVELDASLVAKLRSDFPVLGDIRPEFLGLS